MAQTKSFTEHGWSVGLRIERGLKVYVPRCLCGWEGVGLQVQDEAAFDALAHVRGRPMTEDDVARGDLVNGRPEPRTVMPVPVRGRRDDVAPVLALDDRKHDKSRRGGR